MAKMESDRAKEDISKKEYSDVPQRILAETSNSFIQDLFVTKEEDGI